MTTDESQLRHFICSACSVSTRFIVVAGDGSAVLRIIRLFSSGFNRLVKKPCHV
jgi:hypothetical protein